MHQRQIQLEPIEKLKNKIIKRRLRLLKKWSNSLVGFFPKEIYRNLYWNHKIPIWESVVDPINLNYKIRKKVIQCMVDAMINVLNEKNKSHKDKPCKVMCLISLRDMFSSEITVFFNKNYYDNFFIRDNEYQKQELIINSNQRSLLKENHIKIPSSVKLQEQGYIETILNEDWMSRGELWSIGELGDW